MTILDIRPLTLPWQTRDPFLFTMHHKDAFPKGTASLGMPAHELAGRNIGNDFSNLHGFSMYHGKTHPGFPVHPHRGFETVTYVTKGFVDHSDSHGAKGRYGEGDVQWMTAGSGMQHSEMFPLIQMDEPNPLELFQIWLNLPAKDKFTEPNYKMLWAEDIPVINHKDELGKKTKLVLVAGSYDGIRSTSPAPASWANKPENHVNIWHIIMEPESTFELPPISATLNRTLYYYEGGSIQIDATEINQNSMILLDGNATIPIKNGSEKSSFILMEGEPIGEPVAMYGPFVMNTEQEITNAYNDYHNTHFGGWPWESDGPVFPRDHGRFALHEDGTLEKHY